MNWPGHIIAEWAQLWQTPELSNVKIEFSTRMTTTLGRSFPKRRLVRLNARLKDDLSDHLLEVLRHELAHQAIYDRFGRTTKPHGPRWRQLVEKAGYPVRTRVAVRQERQPAPLYRHRCDVCGMTRVAKRSMPRWRCYQCVEDGLKGELTITIGEPS